MKSRSLLPCLLAGLTSLSVAQDITEGPAAEVRMPAVRMSYTLWDFERGVLERGEDPLQAASRGGFTLDPQGRINVELVGRAGQPALGEAFLAPFGGRSDALWRHRTSAWLAVGSLEAAARALPEGYFLEAVLPPCPDDDPEEVFAQDCGVQAYRDAGAKGSGIKVAIIDSGFTNLSDAQDAGTAPTGSKINCKSYSGDIDSGSKHGTACLETVYDHASSATYYIYKAANVTHLGKAVDDAIDNGVDVISHSISRYNLGWDDDEGDACDAAKEAADNGLLFFTSAGNRAESHWQGTFNAGGDKFHNFGTGDETIDITLSNGSGGNFYLAWDTDESVDYDLYLYDSDVSTVLDKSASILPNSFESFYYENNSGSSKTVHLAVKRKFSKTVEFEVFFHGADFDEHQVAAGSTTSPSNSTEGNVISCGAVVYSEWDKGEGTSSIIQSYSSNGPSNSGRTLPDLCGATGNHTEAYKSSTKVNGAFGGTSCATPNAAGVAACFWSEFPGLTGSAVRYLLFEQADIARDWGAAGKDDVYGEGGIFLHDYHADTVWVDGRYTDWAAMLGSLWDGSTMFGPFPVVGDALQVAAHGGRLLFLGQSYDEQLLIDADLRIETIGWQAALGE